jgi:hypothetical protein
MFKIFTAKMASALAILTDAARRLWWIVPIVAMGMIFWLFYQGYIPLKGANLSERGQFGDSFGVLNSLFTGLGFGGLVITLLLQQKQISYQESEIKFQRQSEQIKQYEETLFLLMSMYAATLSEVSTEKGNLQARTALRGSTDRVFEAIKREKAQLVPDNVQERYRAGRLAKEDKEFLDYLYFRNFKILSVEIDRQGRLIQTLKVLLHHLVYKAPTHLEIKPYCDMVCAQITQVEVSYFFLVALAFSDEFSLRDLLLKSGLLNRAAHIKRLRIHDYMYEEFWGQNIRSLKTPQFLPISDSRINLSIKAYRRRMGPQAVGDLRSYHSPRARPNLPEKEAQS